MSSRFFGWHQRNLQVVIYGIVALLLLWLTLRQVTFAAIWQIFTQLQRLQLLNWIALNCLVLATMVLRWRILLVAMGYKIGFWPLLRYRLAAFGMTYFTPGPQFGGEPLQIYLIHKRHPVPLEDAIATVTLDKLLEMFVNFGFLAGGIVLLLSQGLLEGGWAYLGLLLALSLLAIPLLLFGAYLYGSRPLQSLNTWLSRQSFTQQSFNQLWQDNKTVVTVPMWVRRGFSAACQSELQVVQLCKKAPMLLAGGLAITLVGWCFMILEFTYAIHMLGAPLTFQEIITLLLAARAAYLLPMPAGIGAFESSLALTFHWLHYDPAIGIALSLLIRSRDIVLGSTGLWLGGLALGRRGQSANLQMVNQHTDDSQTPILYE